MEGKSTEMKRGVSGEDDTWTGLRFYCLDSYEHFNSVLTNSDHFERRFSSKVSKILNYSHKDTGAEEESLLSAEIKIPQE